MTTVEQVQTLEESGGMALSGHVLSRVWPGFAGAVLCIAALGLWVVPGANWDAALLLIKLGFSVFLALGGAMFLMAARRTVRPEVHLNPALGRMKLIERDRSGGVLSQRDVPFGDLSEVDFRDGIFVARDQHGRALVEMPMRRAVDLEQIRAALGPAFCRTA